MVASPLVRVDNTRVEPMHDGLSKEYFEGLAVQLCAKAVALHKQFPVDLLRYILIVRPRLFPFRGLSVLSLRHPNVSQSCRIQSTPIHAEEYWTMVAQFHEQHVIHLPEVKQNREALRANPGLQQAMRRIWQRLLPGDVKCTGNLTKGTFLYLEMRMRDLLCGVGEFTLAQHTVEHDIRQSINKHGIITFATFSNSLLQVADNWTRGTSIQEYSVFITGVEECCFTSQPSALIGLVAGETDTTEDAKSSTLEGSISQLTNSNIPENAPGLDPVASHASSIILQGTTTHEQEQRKRDEDVGGIVEKVEENTKTLVKRVSHSIPTNSVQLATETNIVTARMQGKRNSSPYTGTEIVPRSQEYTSNDHHHHATDSNASFSPWHTGGDGNSKYNIAHAGGRYADSVRFLDPSNAPQGGEENRDDLSSTMFPSQNKTDDAILLGKHSNREAHGIVEKTYASNLTNKMDDTQLLKSSDVGLDAHKPTLKYHPAVANTRQTEIEKGQQSTSPHPTHSGSLVSPRDASASGHIPPFLSITYEPRLKVRRREKRKEKAILEKPGGMLDAIFSGFLSYAPRPPYVRRSLLTSSPNTQPSNGSTKRCFHPLHAKHSPELFHQYQFDRLHHRGAIMKLGSSQPVLTFRGTSSTAVVGNTPRLDGIEHSNTTTPLSLASKRSGKDPSFDGVVAAPMPPTMMLTSGSRFPLLHPSHKMRHVRHTVHGMSK